MNVAKKFQPPTEEEISQYAYHLWESDGRVHGRDLDYWLQAKAHLTAHREYEAGILQQIEKNPDTKTPGVVAPANIRGKSTKQRRQNLSETAQAYA